MQDAWNTVSTSLIAWNDLSRYHPELARGWNRSWFLRFSFLQAV